MRQQEERGKMFEKDCFAFAANGCKILRRNTCDYCSFYKKKGTECDTCYYKSTERCKDCAIKDN